MYNKEYRKIEEWRQAGLISDAVAENIKQYELKKQKANPRLLVAIIGVIAAVLVGLGIILLFAHNWEHLSRTSRLMVCFLPLLCGQSMFVYYRSTNKDSMPWREGSTIIWALGFVFALAMADQTFHLTPDAALMFHICCWFLLAIAYLSQGFVVLLMYYLCSILFVLNVDTSHQFYTYKAYFIVLWLIAMPLLLKHTTAPSNNRIQIWLELVAVASFYISLVKVPAGNNPFESFIHLSSFLIVGSASKLIANHTHNTLSKLMYYISIAGASFVFYIFSFSKFWQHYSVGSFFATHPLSLWAGILMALPPAIWLLAILLKKVNTSYLVRDPIFYQVVLSIVLPFVGPYFPIACVLLSHAFILTLAIIFIRQGISQQNAFRINFGLLLIGILITCRFFDMGLSFVGRGVGFIVIGCIFLIVNFYLTKKKNKS